MVGDPSNEQNVNCKAVSDPPEGKILFSLVFGRTYCNTCRNKAKPLLILVIKKILYGEQRSEVTSALPWPLFNYKPAVLYVFAKVRKLDQGIFCSFHGQSVVSPDSVDGEAQAEEEEAGVMGRLGPGGG